MTEEHSGYQTSDVHNQLHTIPNDFSTPPRSRMTLQDTTPLLTRSQSQANRRRQRYVNCLLVCWICQARPQNGTTVIAASRRIYNSKTYGIIYIILAVLNLGLLIYDAVNYSNDIEGTPPPIWFVVLDFFLTGALIVEIVVRLLSGADSAKLRRTLKDWVLWVDVVIAILSTLSSIATALQDSPILIGLGPAVLIFRYVGHALRLFTFIRTRRRMARLNSTANLFQIDFDQVEDKEHYPGNVYNGAAESGRPSVVDSQGHHVDTYQQQHYHHYSDRRRRESVDTVSTVASEDFEGPGKSFVVS